MAEYHFSSDGSDLSLELTSTEATMALTNLMEQIKYYLTHEQVSVLSLVFHEIQPILPEGYDLRVMSQAERATEDKVRRLAQQGYYRDEAVEVALDLKKALQALLDYDGRQ